MDDLFTTAIKKIGAAAPLDAVKVPAGLAEITFPLKALQLHCYNWKGPGLQKIYAMRMRVTVPSLDILGMALYPAAEFDVPIFTFDLSCTSKKVMTYVNCIRLGRGEAYDQKYIEPLRPVRARYTGLAPHRMPEWMQAYRTDCTIYAMPEREHLEKLKTCVLDYLDVYLELLAGARPVNGPAQRQAAQQAADRFRHDLITKDRSQAMLGKIIGKQRAARIFKEVLI